MTSIKLLEAITLRINTVMQAPIDTYTKKGDALTSNIGNFHISQAYGGVCLYRISNESGGVYDVFSCGHVPKKELSIRMYSFLRGVDAALCR
jgi:hypothetical protein